MGRLDVAAGRQRWLRRMQQFTQSRLTVVEFCRLENVSVTAFYQWRKELARQLRSGVGLDSADAAPATGGVLAANAATRTSNNFVPVRLLQPYAASTPRAAAIEVRFRNGVTLSFPTGDQEALRLVLTIVSQLPALAHLDAEGESC